MTLRTSVHTSSLYLEQTLNTMMEVSCVLMLATFLAMLDVGQCGEYPFEYTNYDNAGWSEPNSVGATRRQHQQYHLSPNPTLTRRQQQLLGALINPGTAAAGAGVSTPAIP